MATPTVVYAISSASSALDRNAAYGAFPSAGDLHIEIVSLLSNGGGTPTFTPPPGWTVFVDEATTISGVYPFRLIAMRKVLTSAEASNIPNITTNANLATARSSWGVRGAAEASFAYASLINATSDQLTWPSVATSTGALTLRAATGAGNMPFDRWPNVVPAGHTRVTSDGNAEAVACYVTSSGATTGEAGPVLLNNPGSVIPVLSVTISLSDTAGPDVTAPTITSSASPSVKEGVALSHTLTADETVTWTKVGGANAAAFTLTGANLSLPAQTYPSGPFVVTVRATDAAGNWTEQTITVTVKAVPISFVGAATGTTTPVLPAHQAGDFLTCFMFRDGNTTAPALPSGWTSAATGAGTTCSYRLAYKIAKSSSESGGGATTATTCITSVYRPKVGFALLMGVVAPATGATNSLTYPALTLQNTDGTSWVGAAAGHRSTNTTLETPPAGMVLRSNPQDATDEGAAFDTNGGVYSWVGSGIPLAGTASGWAAVVYEIKVTSSITRKAPRNSFWL